MSGAVASLIPPNVSSPAAAAARCASVEADEVCENCGVEVGPVAMLLRCATEVDMVGAGCPSSSVVNPVVIEMREGVSRSPGGS